MFELPKTTEFNRRIPKKKFFEKLEVSPEIKKGFEVIKTITWKNKLSPETINLEKGKDVQEIQVFEVKLAKDSLIEKVLRQMDRQIPYHILYLVELDGKWQAWITYKENSTGKNAFTIGKYYHTEWQSKEELPIQITGLNLDSVYENFIRQIAGNELKQGTQTETLKQTIHNTDQIKVLEKQIAALQKKIKKEKQLNKQMEMNAELKQLKRELQTFGCVQKYSELQRSSKE